MIFVRNAAVYFCILLITLINTSFIPKTPVNAPLARVWFYGAKLNYDSLDHYRNKDEFDHFVFQPMMRDADDRRDYYYLVCYAIATNGAVMKDGDTIGLEVLYNIHMPVENKLSLANIKVTRDHLTYLYPGIDTRSDLTLKPKEYSKKPDYVSYVLETTTRGGALGSTATGVRILATLTINPSPPAQPLENVPPVRQSNN